MLVLSDRTDRIPETASTSPNTAQLRQLVDRRLAIAQKGLEEARRHLAAGQDEDAGIVLEKLDEDLHLLRRRLNGAAGRRPSVLCGRPDASEAN